MKTSFAKMPENKRLRMYILALVDVFVVLFGEFMGLWIRFDLSIDKIPANYIDAVLSYTSANIIVTLLIFLLLSMYTTLWSSASFPEAARIVTSCVLSGMAQIVGMALAGLSVPRSYFIIYTVTLIACELVIRFSYRLLVMVTGLRSFWGTGDDLILVAGAGSSGAAILKETLESKYVKKRICCFADDDTQKVGKRLNGVKIEGTCDEIPELVKKYGIREIYIAMPAATVQQRKRVAEICSETGCRLKILPGIYQLINGEVSISRLRDVQIEDLLGREQIETNLDEVMGYISGKVVMITGGGGSIGSELCRQIARYNPSQLIIFDIYENNAYDIQQELVKTCPGLNLAVLIGSVRNTNRLEDVFATYRPQIVFHAAAHKHVPLMEDSPCEAVKNNVFGTYKTVYMADRYGVERFVLISTDKAVNPTSIMGATKRICEMIVQTMNKKSRTEFVAVRFGNVLGSNGSVIPLFKKQIAAGGPVTVTDKNIVRFFMTIPEAVSLVLQAGAYARGGEIFVLDMGDAVRIDDMARKLIKLSGYTPDQDIKVEYTGLRPGEKLYEEILMDEEGMQDTANHRIHIGKPIQIDEEWFLNRLSVLDEESYNETRKIREMIHEIVPEYQIPKNPACPQPVRRAVEMEAAAAREMVAACATDPDKPVIGMNGSVLYSNKHNHSENAV